MTQAVFDALTMLHSGIINNSQSFSPLQVNPRMLGTSAWAINVTTPPVASATLSLEIATTSAGAYSPIASLVWPAGQSGSKIVPIGIQGMMAAARNNAAQWMRVSVVCTGAFSASSWLTKAGDGGPGLGTRSLSLDGLNVL